MLQVIADMWHLFEKEFRGLWSAAVKKGDGGELALDALFGSKAPAGTETLKVGLLCVCVVANRVSLVTRTCSPGIPTDP